MGCAVVACNSDNQFKRNPCKDINFFHFPKDPNLSKKWLHLSKRKDKVNIKYATVCSKHFCESDYKVNLKHTLLVSLPESSTSSVGEERKSVCEKRKRAELIKDIMTKDIIQTNETCQKMEELENKLLLVTTESQKLKHQLADVKKVFSENQIKKIDNQKRITWSVNEISNAISMFAAGPRAYRLSLKRGFPYPAVSTLKRCLSKIKLDQGILRNVLKITEFAEMTKKDRVCTIVIDEMKVRKEYQYDQAKDCVVKPYDYVQVVLIKGIFRSWKQPVFMTLIAK
nr:unnamed protein product [Callosobruchus chinensis]